KTQGFRTCVCRGRAKSSFVCWPSRKRHRVAVGRVRGETVNENLPRKIVRSRHCRFALHRMATFRLLRLQPHLQYTLIAGSRPDHRLRRGHITNRHTVRDLWRLRARLPGLTLFLVAWTGLGWSSVRDSPNSTEEEHHGSNPQPY